MATNWANRQKEALAAVTPAAPAGMKRITGSGGEGNGSVDIFYRFTPSTTGNGVVLEKGNTVEGTYLGSPVTKMYNKPFHKIRTANNETVALPSAGQLDKAMAKLTVGTNVKVIYNGRTKITTGRFAGKEAHLFEVYAAE
jgi:hypothetical protein